MEQTAWISRTFNFDFPVGLFPVIIGRLSGTYARLAEITNNCNANLLTYQPQAKWSIQQHIGHLIDLEELHTGRLADYKSGASVLRAWDGVNQKTNLGNHNQQTLQQLLSEFKRVRNILLFDLTSFSDKELINTAMHPRLEVKMRIVDLAYFIAEHDDHHIAKIITILNK